MQNLNIGGLWFPSMQKLHIGDERRGSYLPGSHRQGFTHVLERPVPGRSNTASARYP
jgi:hypothetical protein